MRETIQSRFGGEGGIARAAPATRLKMRTLFGVVWICAVLTAAAARGDDLTDQEKAARDFAFEKTKLGISLVDFKKRFPKAQLNEDSTDPKLKQVGYIAEAASASGCQYAFLDDKLYQLTIAYSTEKVDKLGGWRVLLEKLTDKFGKCDEGDLEITTKPLKVNGVWRFPKVDRRIYFSVESTHAGIMVTDVVLERELDQRKKKAAKTGFDD
jgi:hypothetical protein